MKNFRITEGDFINAVRKADREREIQQHGKQISTRPTRVHKSNKVYSRKGKNKFSFNG